MNVDGKDMQTIWVKQEDHKTIQIIDQRYLPFNLVIEDLHTSDDVVAAIADMHVRGAPLIGVTAAYGVYLACLQAEASSNFDTALPVLIQNLRQARPTAVNLNWAIDRQMAVIATASSPQAKIKAAFNNAGAILLEDAEMCRQIGLYGLELIKLIAAKKGGEPVNILTHCNAGWLACINWGTATSPMYHAHDAGVPIHVWVDETRPRSQGARLTAWELGQHGVPHTVIADNTGGHLMQHGMVDIVIVGSDRTTYTGDVANKIGTYLKALAAADNHVPFYAALPSSTIDWDIEDGVQGIPIEKRDPDEVKYAEGLLEGSSKDETKERRFLLTPKASPAANYAFDVTPSRLVTGIITERGVCPATGEGILGLFPEQAK